MLPRRSSRSSSWYSTPTWQPLRCSWFFFQLLPLVSSCGFSLLRYALPMRSRNLDCLGPFLNVVNVFFMMRMQAFHSVFNTYRVWIHNTLSCVLPLEGFVNCFTKLIPKQAWAKKITYGQIWLEADMVLRGIWSLLLSTVHEHPLHEPESDGLWDRS